MLFFEAFIKFTSLGLLIAIGSLIVRDGRGTKALSFSLPAIASICFLLVTTGSPEISLTGPIAIPLRLFDSMAAIFFWWLGLTLFDDEFEVGKREWLVAALYAVMMISSRLYHLGFDIYWHYSFSFIVPCFTCLLMMHLCYKALVGHKEDLVEPRRQIRFFFVVAITMATIAVNVVERLMIDTNEMAALWILYLFILPQTLLTLLWLARVHPEVLVFDSKEPVMNGVINIDDRDKAAYQRLIDIMETEHAYTNHGLTIGKLAELVGIPPHQLRKLINQTMGYRNFSNFLNRYRIAAVKKALVKPEKVRIPILTLAIDAGYSSLATFNRAFKTREGVTPTDFRARSLAHSSEKPTQN